MCSWLVRSSNLGRPSSASTEILFLDSKRDMDKYIFQIFSAVRRDAQNGLAADS